MASPFYLEEMRYELGLVFSLLQLYSTFQMQELSVSVLN